MKLDHFRGKSSLDHQSARIAKEDEKLWSDEDDEIVAGPAWSMILIFAVVPVVMIASLVFGLFAMISTAFGAPYPDLLAISMLPPDIS